MTRDPHRLKWRLLNAVARAYGVLSVLTGVMLILGGVLTEKDGPLALVCGMFSLVVGILFLKVKKGSEADVEKLFRREE